MGPVWVVWGQQAHRARQCSHSGEASMVAASDVSRGWGLSRELRGGGLGLVPGRGWKGLQTQLKSPGFRTMFPEKVASEGPVRS